MSNDTQIAAQQSDQALIKSLITLKGQEAQIVTRGLVYLNEVYPYRKPGTRKVNPAVVAVTVRQRCIEVNAKGLRITYD